MTNHQNVKIPYYSTVKTRKQRHGVKTKKPLYTMVQITFMNTFRGGGWVVRGIYPRYNLFLYHGITIVSEINLLHGTTRDFFFSVFYAFLILAQRVVHGRNTRGPRVVHGRNTRGPRELNGPL
jgi:hypothetical protein